MFCTLLLYHESASCATGDHRVGLFKVLILYSEESKRQRGLCGNRPVRSGNVPIVQPTQERDGAVPQPAQPTLDHPPVQTVLIVGHITHPSAKRGIESDFRQWDGVYLCMVMRSPLFGNGSGRIHNRTRHHPCASTRRIWCIPRRSRRFPRCAVPLATGRNPLRFGTVDPWADDHRPQRDHRHPPLLPGGGIRVRQLTALPVPAYRRASAAARRVPAAQGRPRSVPRRGWTPDERRPRFRVVGPPRHRQQARHPRRGGRERIPHAHPSMPRSGRPAPHRPSHLTGRREGRVVRTRLMGCTCCARIAGHRRGLPTRCSARTRTSWACGRARQARRRIRAPCGSPAPGWCAAPPSPPRVRGGSGGWRPAGPCRASGRARAGVRAPLGGI